jgi:hypothetical protein
MGWHTDSTDHLIESERRPEYLAGSLGSGVLIRDTPAERERKLDALAAEMDRRMAALEARLEKCERDRAKTLRLWDEAGLLGQSETPAG